MDEIQIRETMWRTHVAQLSTMRVPGNHMTMLSMPHVAQFAAYLRGCLGSLYPILFSGAKELKLHLSRAHAFLTGTLGSEIDAVRHHRTRALSAYAFGASWSIFLFYVFLGLPVEIVQQYLQSKALQLDNVSLTHREI